MIIVFLIVIALIAFDQLSKLYFELNYSVGHTKDLIDNFLYFTKAYNKGAAWSSFSDSTFMLVMFSLIASVGITIFIFKTVNLKTKKVYSVSLIFMLAGTFGNLIDRFLTLINVREGVVDFIGVYLGNYSFPIFNVADSLLVVGVILLTVDMLFFEEKRKEKALENTESEEENEENNN